MSEKQIENILSDIVNKYISKQINSDEVQNHLMKNINPDEIYDIEDNKKITDCYFALKHLKETGYETMNAEIRYFSECFSGKREYSLEEKNVIIREQYEER